MWTEPLPLTVCSGNSCSSALLLSLFPANCLNLHKILRTILDTFRTSRFSTVAEMELIIHSPVSIWKVPGYLFDVLKRAGMARCHMLTHPDHSPCAGCYRVISHSQRCNTASSACLVVHILLDSVISSYLWNMLVAMIVIFTTPNSKFPRNKVGFWCFFGIC